LIFLLVGSLFTAFVYDKGHTKMYFTRLSKTKLETGMTHSVVVRASGVDAYFALGSVAGMAFIVTNLVAGTIFNVDVSDNALWHWPVLVIWVEVAVLALCMGIYIRRHVEKQHVGILTKSSLFWQMLVLAALYMGLNLALPVHGQGLQTVPSNLFIFISMTVPVVMDTCNTTAAESRIALAILIVTLLLATFANLFFYDNVILYEGFYATVDLKGRQVWTGQITKNGLRLNILYSQTLLLLGSLTTAVLFDKDHVKMYHCKCSRDKPLLVRKSYHKSRQCSVAVDSLTATEDVWL
jgi:hypothetical protein